MNARNVSPSTLVAALAVALASAGCIRQPLPSGYFPRHAPADLKQPVLDRQREFFRDDPSLLARETSVLILEDHSKLKHGREVEWYEDGQIRTEREFRRGEPVGTWKSYYPDGTLRSLASFDDTGEPVEMTWWYESGQISSQGLAVRGIREGDWVEFYETGSKKGEGRYYGNRRSGLWTYWHPDGSVKERGNYSGGGVRVGRWERWRPGERAADMAAVDDEPQRGAENPQ